jgi:hypothetical protein
MEVRSVETIVKSLNHAGVKYLIVGGVAVVAHGYERLTKDLDLVIGLERENIIRGLRALMKIGYHMPIPVTPEDFADKAKRAQWRKSKNMIVLKLWSDTHRRTPVDVFVYEPFDFDAEYAAAKHEKVMPNVKAPVVSLKTLLKMKRAAGRPQDLADIVDLKRIGKLKREFP